MTSPVIDLPVRQSDEPTVVPYDFRRPVKLSRDHVRAMQMAFDALARRLTTLLTSGLRQVCQVRVGEVSQRAYDDLVHGLPSPSVTVPFGITPLGGAGIVHFSLPVSLAAIDHMLGGPGGNQPTRTLTDIEVPLLHNLLEQITGVLRFALEPIVALDFTIGAVEYNPQFLQAAGAADAVIVGEFALQIGAVSSPLLIALPLTPMLPVLEAQRPAEPEAGDAGLRDALAARIARRVSDVPLDVSLRFDDVTLPADVVLTLAPGDVVPLGHRVGAPLSLHAGGVAYARAVTGRTGTTLAALVVDVPGPAAPAGPAPAGPATPAVTDPPEYYR